MSWAIVCFSSTTLVTADGRDKKKNKKKSSGKRDAEQEAQSEEDGSSASAALVAHDSLRLANYALRSIRHRPINHMGSRIARCSANTSAAVPHTQWEMISLPYRSGANWPHLRRAVGHRHEESDAEPQSLQQDDYQPLRPVKHHVLDELPPAKL